MSLMPTLTIHACNAGEDAPIETIVALWNAAVAEEFAVSTRLVEFNLRQPAGGSVQSWLAMLDERPVGFIVASHLAGRPHVVLPAIGWIGAMAVSPEHQRQGIGAWLVQEAEQWLRDRGVTQIMLGGDVRPFMPGAPLALQSRTFFACMGYADAAYGNRDGVVWDVARDLAGYVPPACVKEIAGVVRPAQPGEMHLLLDFLQREFPGRWRYETEELLREGMRISDWMLLWTESGVDGFCTLTFEDSLRPIERYYPYSLPRRWGHLGPIGISSHLRGQGYGAALLDASLRRLHNNGVNGSVIDWTTLLEFYGKFGFEPYHAYQHMAKNV